VFFNGERVARVHAREYRGVALRKRTLPGTDT
jgi:hypothetical protein